MVYIGNGVQGQDDVQNRNNPEDTCVNTQQNCFRNFKSHTGIKLLTPKKGWNKKLEGGDYKTPPKGKEVFKCMGAENSSNGKVMCHIS